jgi:hypothetical protein
MSLYINNTYTDYDTNIEAFDYVINNIGKYHLSKLSPKLKFYLSGPKDLEIFRLIKLKREGVDNESIANILLSASGKFAPLGKKGKSVLKKEGFNKKVISIIDNYNFLSSGKKLKIKDIVVMSNNGVKPQEIANLIIESDLSNIKYTKKGLNYLLKLGVDERVIRTMVYKKLLLSGPYNYKLYDIFVDLNINKLPEDEIIKKINSTNWFYKDYSERELRTLIKYGLSENILKAMKDATQKYSSLTSKQTKEYVAKMQKESNQEKNNFAKMKTNLMNKAAINNAVLQGLHRRKPESLGKRVAKTVGNCAARALGLKACDKTPFPLNLGCSALVKNKFPCGG